MRPSRVAPVVVSLACAVVACGDDGGSSTEVNTDHCTYEPPPATARAGGSVTAGAITAGAAERILDVPVGTALGGYTARAGFLGDAGEVDNRKNEISGSFNPSIGVYTAPRAKALALSTPDETIVIVKLDAIFVYEGMLADLETRLGGEYYGKVLLASSHTHSGWAQHSGHSALKVGGGELRDLVYQRVLAGAEGAARDALAARRPARIGILADTGFDPTDQINRDRRGENNELMGGARKDDHLYLIRVDGTDAVPIAAVAVFGEHGTLSGEDNPLASNDAPGAAERWLEQRLPPGTIAIHLQGAGADTSPTPHGDTDCDLKPGRPTDPCFSPWTAEEGHGVVASAALFTAWQDAGGAMRDTIELEMMTRSVELGPFAETFTVRDGALSYAPFDLERTIDGNVSSGGQLVSPIDEWNAPVGAALCETDTPMFPAAVIPGAEGVFPYGSCLRMDVAGEILGPIFSFDFETSDVHPICQTTRTNISTLRLGEYVVGTLPGEVSVLITDMVRAKSPIAGDNTIVVGYAQGHVGYILTPEDWVLGGYECSVSFNGPLEGEYLVEQLAALMPMATTTAREDGAAGGASRLAPARAIDMLAVDDPAPMAGTVATAVPPETWIRSGTPANGQPEAVVRRVEGIAQFVWYGDDPHVKTPVVTLQRNTGGNWAAVTRPNGRAITDGEIVLTYTPQPLRRTPGQAQTHVWAVEFQPVPPWGAVDLLGASNAALGSLPTGMYRFHIEGNGWTLDSSAFDVAQGGLVASATRPSATTAEVTVVFDAPRGYRLLSLTGSSNRAVPLRQGDVTVRFRNGAGTVLATDTGTTDDMGRVTADGGAGAGNAVEVEVEDMYGNRARAPLP